MLMTTCCLEMLNLPMSTATIKPCRNYQRNRSGVGMWKLKVGLKHWFSLSVVMVRGVGIAWEVGEQPHIWVGPGSSLSLPRGDLGVGDKRIAVVDPVVDALLRINNGHILETVLLFPFVASTGISGG